jgi:hypothetical protein
MTTSVSLDFTSSTEKASALGPGMHVVRVTGFQPAWHRTKTGETAITRDRDGRPVWESAFADRGGSTARLWMARASLWRPDGSRSAYGQLRFAAALVPEAPIAHVVGRFVRVTISLDRKGRAVVVDVARPR